MKPKTGPFRRSRCLSAAVLRIVRQMRRRPDGISEQRFPQHRNCHATHWSTTIVFAEASSIVVKHRTPARRCPRRPGSLCNRYPIDPVHCRSRPRGFGPVCPASAGQQKESSDMIGSTLAQETRALAERPAPPEKPRALSEPVSDARPGRNG